MLDRNPPASTQTEAAYWCTASRTSSTPPCSGRATAWLMWSPARLKVLFGPESTTTGADGVPASAAVVPMDVAPGDLILFGKYSGQEIKIEGEEYLIMREEEVLAVLEQGGKSKKK